jgi:putative ABC transport system permease protein
MNNLLNFKSFFRFLERNKLYSFINVFGLSVSLMFVILIAVYTAQELSVDRFHAKGDRIYLMSGVKSQDNSRGFHTAYRLADRLAERYPEVEKVCPMTSTFRDVPATVDRVKYSVDMLFADTTFFDIFSFPLVAGSPSQALAGKFDAVVSESFARRAFPGGNPLGQRIELYDSLVVTVAGVMKDIRNSAIPASDIVVRMDNVGRYNPGMDSQSYTNAGSAVIYVLAREGADLRAREPDVAALFKEIFWIFQRGFFDAVEFVPLRDVYFSGIDGGELVNGGDRTFVLVLLSAGLLILIFAVINYINLTVAQTGFRAKEMATRRLLGSSRGELFARLMLESALLCFLSFAAGLLLAFACEPYAAGLLERRLDIAAAVSPLSVLAAAAVIAAIGIVSGLMPATIISRAKAVDVMKGSLRTKTKMVFSKVFIIFQNAFTIALVAAALTMVLQTRHLIHAPLGYRTENIIHIDLNLGEYSPQLFSTLRSELEAQASVRRTSYCMGTPFNRGNNLTIVHEERNISTQWLIGDENYFDMLGFRIIRDNGLATGEGFYINEYALQEFGAPADVASIRIDGREYAIAGVVRDFRLSTVTAREQPVFLQMRRFGERFNPWNMLVEVQGNAAAAYADVQRTYERVTGMEFPGQFIDRQVADAYASQQRLARLVSFFGVIAVLVSLLGLLAMSTYFIQQRAREIAVRKVFGSSNPEVLRRLVTTFLNYVFIAFVIAVPAVWYIMHRWLADYSYRIALSPLIFVAAGLFCLLISFATVFGQSYLAANRNPVKSLKAE